MSLKALALQRIKGESTGELSVNTGGELSGQKKGEKFTTVKAEKTPHAKLSKLPKPPFDSKDSSEGRRFLKKSKSLPAWCTGPECSGFEELDLPRQGLIAGCVIREHTQETWRRLDKLAACPVWN